MRQTLQSKMIQEVKVILAISRRDMPKRVATSVMICVLMWTAGQHGATYAVLCLVLTSEAIFSTLHHVDKRLPAGETLPLPLVKLNWVASTISTIAFCLPSAVLAGSGSVPLAIAGLMWLFGVLVHITNTYVDLPLYNRSQVVQVFAMLLATLFVAYRTEHEQGNDLHWGFLAAFAVIYIVNSVQTMTLQRDTSRKLERARSEAQSRLRALERIVRLDTLTNLLNRSSFEDELRGRIARASPAARATVLVIDLDDFKPVNDSYGHDTGDAVLREIAERLRRLARDGPAPGIAARIGGDEFAIGLVSEASEASILGFGNRIAEDLSRPASVAGLDIKVGASVGISIAERGMTDVARLASEADQAMYRAKGDPGANAVLYNPSFAPRLSLEDKARIVSALETGAIRPHYQPKIDLETGQIVGFEALARWVREDGTIWSPGVFTPQIEELRLHPDLLTCITRQVLADLPRLRAAGLGAGRVAINLPESALASIPVRTAFLELLNTEPASFSNLTLEITEDVVIGRAGALLQESIQLFRSRGALISLDDFGTGYASFQHLRHLDFDELKIDKSFVAGLCTEETATVLVEGFLTIARGLQVAVVAEGVETGAQEEMLRIMGCRLAQGYRYGRAEPVEVTLQLLRSGAPLTAPLAGPITAPRLRAAPEAEAPPAGRAARGAP